MPQNSADLIVALNTKQIDTFLKLKKKDCCGPCKNCATTCSKLKQEHYRYVALLFITNIHWPKKLLSKKANLISQPGIIITMVLLALPILLATISNNK